MTIPMRNQGPRPEPAQSPRRVDARALFSGGAATAVVAGLIALVGILVCRWLFKVPILSPSQDGAWGDASTVGYVFAAVACALVATGLIYLLMISTPRPQLFFGWIIGLATVVAVVFPFSTTAPLSQKVATGLVNLVLGIAIGSLVSGVSMRVGRRRVLASGYPQQPPQAYPPARPSAEQYPPTRNDQYPPTRGDQYPRTPGDQYR
jgi:Family of unknown function (DUF6069)